MVSLANGVERGVGQKVRQILWRPFRPGERRPELDLGLRNVGQLCRWRSVNSASSRPLDWSSSSTSRLHDFRFPSASWLNKPLTISPRSDGRRSRMTPLEPSPALNVFLAQAYGGTSRSTRPGRRVDVEQALRGRLAHEAANSRVRVGRQKSREIFDGRGGLPKIALEL